MFSLGFWSSWEGGGYATVLCSGRSGEQNWVLRTLSPSQGFRVTIPGLIPRTEWLDVWNVMCAPEVCSAVELNPNRIPLVHSWIALHCETKCKIHFGQIPGWSASEMSSWLGSRDWCGFTQYVFPAGGFLWHFNQHCSSLALLSLSWDPRLRTEERVEGSFPACGHGSIKCIPLYSTYWGWRTNPYYIFPCYSEG